MEATMMAQPTDDQSPERPGLARSRGPLPARYCLRSPASLRSISVALQLCLPWVLEHASGWLCRI